MLSRLRCQCPSSGLLHFYFLLVNTLLFLQNCVNALHRAYSISTHRRTTSFLAQKVVSMPFIGLTPFLPTHTMSIFTTEQCVNALHRAYSISTNYELTNESAKGCVNALHRAYSISTVPSGIPLFMRLPRPVFASNSQNILKIHVFRPFFCLICTYTLYMSIRNQNYFFL